MHILSFMLNNNGCFQLKRKIFIVILVVFFITNRNIKFTRDIISLVFLPKISKYKINYIIHILNILFAHKILSISLFIVLVMLREFKGV